MSGMRRWTPRNSLGADGHAGVRALLAPAVVIRVETTVRDGRHRVVPPEEEPPLVVRQRDALAGDLEVHHGGRGQWPRREELLHGAPDGLRSCQRLRVRREQVQHVASCEGRNRSVGLQALTGSMACRNSAVGGF